MTSAAKMLALPSPDQLEATGIAVHTKVIMATKKTSHRRKGRQDKERNPVVADRRGLSAACAEPARAPNAAGKGPIAHRSAIALFVRLSPTAGLRRCGDRTAGQRGSVVPGCAGCVVSFARVSAKLVRKVVQTLSAEFGAFLIVEIWAAPEGGRANDPAVPTVLPTFTIHAPATAKMTRTVEALEKRLKRVKVLKQRVEVEVVRDGRTHPPDMRPLLTQGGSPRTELFVHRNCRPAGVSKARFDGRVPAAGTFTATRLEPGAAANLL